MSEFSFDVVSKIDQQELSNAIDTTRKELINRFDFKGTHIKIELQNKEIFLEASDKMKMKQMIDLLQSKMFRRHLDIKAFLFGELEANVSGIVKSKVIVQDTLNQEQCKKITKLVKESKLKLQARAQGESVRISGKSKNDLQDVQQLIKEANFDFATVFENYR